MSQLMHTDLLTFDPALPEVTPGQEAGRGMAGKMVDPTLGSELGHDGVNEWKASAALRQKCENKKDQFISSQ